MSYPKEYVLFINLTKKCNIDCQRCYLTPDSRLNSQSLPPDLFGSFLSSDFFDDKELVVIFQGGELSLLGEKRLIEYSEIVRSTRPQAKMAAVSNFLSLPNWLIDIAHEYWGSAIETTFALDKKYTLDGSKDKYIERFERSLIIAGEQGIKTAVNFEINKESIELGPEVLLEIARRTGHKSWEFDISFAFDKFLANPSFNEYGYPNLVSSASYLSLSKYLIELDSKHGEELREIGFESTMLMRKASDNTENTSFNVQKENCFITLNPDGTVTSNPLFSDIPALFMGNIKRTSVSELVKSSSLKRRIAHEKKRVLPCYSCEFFKLCKGGPSLAPLFDGSGECAGSKLLWKYFK